ncbi:hypothetical protein Xen7305DRAFT_00010790, partial [Xenococcus sp. PCC 7305]
FAEALSSARKIKDNYKRAVALSSIATHLPAIFPEALSAARKIKDKSNRAAALSSLVTHLPEILPEAFKTIKSIDFEFDQVRLLILLVPHLPEHLFLEVLHGAQYISSESDKAKLLSKLTYNLHIICDSSIYSCWSELLHYSASLKRSSLLIQIRENIHIISKLGNSNTFREIADAVHDVGRWFP